MESKKSVLKKGDRSCEQKYGVLQFVLEPKIFKEGDVMGFRLALNSLPIKRGKYALKSLKLCNM